MTFRVGQKVACVKFPPPVWFLPNRPEVGSIYIIRGIRTEPHIEGYGVLLEEVINQEILWSDGTTAEWAFHPNNFRPIVERETDISFAHEILRKVTRKDRVPA